MIRVSTRGSEGRPPLGLCAAMEFMAECISQTVRDIPELGGSGEFIYVVNGSVEV